jgi:hypothetical protein
MGLGAVAGMSYLFKPVINLLKKRSRAKEK